MVYKPWITRGTRGGSISFAVAVALWLSLNACGSHPQDPGRPVSFRDLGARGIQLDHGPLYASTSLDSLREITGTIINHRSGSHPLLWQDIKDDGHSLYVVYAWQPFRGEYDYSSAALAGDILTITVHGHYDSASRGDMPAIPAGRLGAVPVTALPRTILTVIVRHEVDNWLDGATQVDAREIVDLTEGATPSVSASKVSVIIDALFKQRGGGPCNGFSALADGSVVVYSGWPSNFVQRTWAAGTLSDPQPVLGYKSTLERYEERIGPLTVSQTLVIVLSVTLLAGLGSMALVAIRGR